MRRVLASLAAAAIAFPLVAADAADDAIWFRVAGEECADKVHTLSFTPGPGESACGWLGGIPLDSVLEEGTQYGLEKGAGGFVLASGEATGQIEVGHQAAGGGSYEIQIDVRINGKSAGSTVATAQTGNVGSSLIEFALTIDDAFVGVPVEKMSVDVLMGGVFVSSGYMQMDNSFINFDLA